MRDHTAVEVRSRHGERLLPRRRLLQAGCAGAASLVLGSLSSMAQTRHAPGVSDTTGTVLPATPQCQKGDRVPPPKQTAGPFYTPDTPERTSLLEPGLKGMPLVVRGNVLNTHCQPIAGALLDFWQADDDGDYDNAGYTLRGHQFADTSGAYRLETIVPGYYPGRTRHIHVRVQAPHGRVLTTQLYFPDAPQNRRDGIFDPRLVMQVRDTAKGGKRAQFAFVLQV